MLATPLDIVVAYLSNVESAIKSLKNIHIEKYEEEYLTISRVNLRIRIRFLTGSLLEISEAIFAENDILNFLSYRYHFQDSKNTLVFRYDNTPHFPKLQNFPNHKHLPTEVIGVEKPVLIKVIEEVKLYAI